MIPAADTRSTLDYALAYIELGWGLCSIEPHTKGPRTRGWNSLALAINTADKAAAEYTAKPNNGIGLFHLASRTCAIDVDDLDCFKAVLGEWGEDIEALFAGAPRIVGREGRDKAIFRLPDGVELGTVKLVWPKRHPDEKPVTVFEMRTGPVQDVLPPTVHPDTGREYRWANGMPTGVPELPSFLAQLWQNWPALKPQLEAACPWRSADDAPPALPPNRSRPSGGQHSDIIGRFNDAHDVVSILLSHGYKKRGKRLLAPTSSTGLAGVVLLPDGRAYSHHASDPLNDGHGHDAFDLYCLFEHGGDVGRAVRGAAELLHLDALPALPVASFETLSESARKRKLLEQPAERPEFLSEIPGELARIPGGLGCLVDHIVASAIKPQRVLAVNAAIAFGGSCMARVYASPTDLRTNPYLVSVAASTAGKDHARKVLRAAMDAVGLRDRIGGDDIKSGAAMHSAAARSPAILFQLDEIGLFLQAVMSPNAGSHQADIVRQLMQFRTSASSIVAGPEYADQKARPRQDIEYPCVVVHGTTTAETLWPALQSGHVVSGFLNRFVICHTEDNAPARQKPSRSVRDIPDTVAEWGRLILAPKGDGNLIGLNPASPYVIPYTPSAERLLDAFALLTDKLAAELLGTGLESLWGRAHANAIEIAMVCAGSINPRAPVICEVCARWSIAWVEYWTRRLVADCRSQIVDAEFSGRCDAVLRILQHESSSTGLSRRDLARHWRGWARLKPREQDEILLSLVRHGDAVAAKRQGNRGPATEIWIAREFAPADMVSETCHNLSQPVSTSVDGYNPSGARG